MEGPIRVDIGLPVHNEEKNIGRLLLNLVTQRLPPGFELGQIIVVTSSTDKTDEISLQLAKLYDQIRVVREKERRGKSAAIRTLISTSNADVILISSGDIYPGEEAVMKLLTPLKDPTIGYTGGRPVPLDGRETFWGFAGHVIWNLQEYFSKQPSGKLGGEMNAFRNGIVKDLPSDIINDDLYLQLAIEKQGYKSVYIPDAVIFTKTPGSLRDYIRQRKRVRLGHIQIRRKLNVNPATADMIKALKVVLREVFWVIAILFIEGAISLIAQIESYLGRLPKDGWREAETTKEITDEEILRRKEEVEKDFTVVG